MLTSWTSRLRRFDVAAPLVVVLVYAWLLALTIPDHGVMWDAWEYTIGDHYLYYFATFDETHLDFAADSIRIYDDPRHPDFHEVTTAYPDNDALTQPLMIWPLGAMAAALSKQIFWRALGIFGPFDASHMVLLPVGAALLLAVWLYARRRFGRWEAMTAMLVVATYPRLWAHMHNNIKDVPTAVWFTLTIIAFVAGMRRRSGLWLGVSAVCWGLGLATKANGVFLPVILGPYFLLMLWNRRRDGQRLLQRHEWISLALYPFIGFALMIALWPLLWQNFPDRLMELWTTLRARGTSNDPTAGWNMMPLRYAFATMPPVVMALATLGLVLAWIRAWRDADKRPDVLLITLWAVVPVARVLVPGANDFDGIRHWLEFIPAIALLAGLGAAPLLNHLAHRLTPKTGETQGQEQNQNQPHGALPQHPAREPESPCTPQSCEESAQSADSSQIMGSKGTRPLGGGVGGETPMSPDLANDSADDTDDAPLAVWPVVVPLILLAMAFAPTVVWMARNHPHEIVYFNSFVGGYAGARERGYKDASDYWCNSYRAGTDWLYEHGEPDAILYLGVAEHLGFYTREVWLRDDIQLRNVVGRDPTELVDEITHATGPVYLMYTTREDWYYPIVHVAEAADRRVVHRIVVDDGTVLIIRDLTQPEPTP